MNLRSLTDDERRLLEALVSAAPHVPPGWSDSLQVQTLDDGNMGSLRLVPKGDLSEDRSFGTAVSESRFTDADGVEVIATLYLDREGQLFEMNVWKTDFAPLVSIPKNITARRTE
jgi:hypothetical protein